MLGLIVIVFICSIPVVASSAQSSQGTNQASQGTGQASQGTGQASQGTPLSGDSVVGLQNPLGNQSLIGFFESILDVIMIFAVPIIVFFIIYAGFLYVTAQGNESKVSTAHMALLYSVIGGVIILGARVILAVISGTIQAF